ncbi:MAG: dephospho-CoA kinase [Bacteroidaceae bacterium]|nr:dephospho-CoA kinase [Bacteroidaceae bacterium]
MSKLRLAITGNIGCGKSVVSRMLSIMGVPVYDCDSRAKSLMQSDEAIKRSLVRMFGEECYNADGSLNREHLAGCIFIDRDNVKRVNALVHPRVKEDFAAWASAEKSDVVAVESAILYESGMIDVVDKVLLVWADEETAIKRVTGSRKMSRQQVVSRLQNQMSADELLILSDYSLRNDDDTPILPQLIEIMEQLH